MLSPVNALRAATSAVPAVRFAVGVVGVVAAAAIAATFLHSVPAAVFAFVVMLILMVLLFAFSIMVVSSPEPFKVPALILLYSCIGLFVAWCTLLTSCAFFDKPRPLPSLIGVLFATQKESVPLETPKPPDNVISYHKSAIEFLELPASIRQKYSGNVSSDLRALPSSF